MRTSTSLTPSPLLSGTSGTAKTSRYGPRHNPENETVLSTVEYCLALQYHYTATVRPSATAQDRTIAGLGDGRVIINKNRNCRVRLFRSRSVVPATLDEEP
jgi:hypothetical protein